MVIYPNTTDISSAWAGKNVGHPGTSFSVAEVHFVSSTFFFHHDDILQTYGANAGITIVHVIHSYQAPQNQPQSILISKKLVSPEATV